MVASAGQVSALSSVPTHYNKTKTIEELEKMGSQIWKNIKLTTIEIYELGCKSKVWNRLIGLAQTVGGALEVSTGSVGIAAPEPISTVGGSVLVIHGVDNIQTGIQVIYTGDIIDTYTHHAVKSAGIYAGLDNETADIIALGVDFTLGAKTYKGLNTNLTNNSAQIVTSAKPSTLVPVSRWGSPLEPGNWAMQGKPTLWNYIWSGKWDFLSNNQLTSPRNVYWYMIPKESLQKPKGFGIDGYIKRAVPGKQRIYKP